MKCSIKPCKHKGIFFWNVLNPFLCAEHYETLSKEKIQAKLKGFYVQGGKIENG